MLNSLLITLLCLIFIQYCYWIARFAFVWKQKGGYDREVSSTRSVSIVVVARNEEAHVAALIRAIASQQYPANQLEFVLVDDNSSDDTLKIALKTLAEYPSLRSRILHNEPAVASPKKDGITMAVKQLVSDVVLVTDADCIMGGEWVISMLTHFSDPKVQFVFGPVRFLDNASLANRLLQLEFASLVASGASAALARKPIMCNGANMAFRRRVFDQVGGYRANDGFVSGDDVFLMHKIQQVFPDSVHFAFFDQAFVYTYPPASVNAFVQQRTRWASKSKGYSDFFTRYMAFLVFLTSFLLLFTAAIAFFNLLYLWCFLLFFFGKFLVDVFFIQKFAAFFGLKNWLFMVGLMNLLYPFYILIIGLRSFFVRSFVWKGRKFSTAGNPDQMK